MFSLVKNDSLKALVILHYSDFTLPGGNYRKVTLQKVNFADSIRNTNKARVI